MASRLFATLAFVFVCQTAHADIYKWVDDEGVTHFGTQPPAQQAVEGVDLSSSGVKLKTIGTDPYAEKIRNSGAAVLLDQEVDVVAGALTGVLSEISENEVDLDCKVAVKNGQHWASKMYEASAKNNSDGYVTDAKFNEMAASIRQAQQLMTVDSCENSTGTEAEFYRCLSNDENHLIACDKLH